ncbi:Hypothetical protein EIN_035480, partial [Entamoeba invadens IP1]
AICFE